MSDPVFATYMTTRECARLLGISVASLEGWRARGEGPPYVRFKRTVRYVRARVDAWMAAREVAATSERS